MDYGEMNRRQRAADELAADEHRERLRQRDVDEGYPAGWHEWSARERNDGAPCWWERGS